jgi:DNA-binding response OmpR family regulator
MRASLDLCQTLRNIDPQLGIIFLYTPTNAEKALKAFSMGANQCVVKPPADAEFHSSIAALTRCSSTDNDAKYLYGPIEIDPFSQIVTVRGASINLTRTQFRILCYFLRNAGRIISTEELRTSIFKSDNSVDNVKCQFSA